MTNAPGGSIENKNKVAKITMQVPFGHQHLHEAYDNAATGVIAIDKGGAINYVNALLAGQSGFTPGDLMGRPLLDIFKDMPPNLQDADGLFAQEVIDAEIEIHANFGNVQCAIVSSTIYTDVNSVTNAYFFVRDNTVHKKKESLFNYLTKAAEELANTRDTQTALNKISELIVPRFANWFSIELVKENKLELLLLKHEDADKIKWALEYRNTYPTDINSNSGSALVARTGTPSFVPVITDEMVTASIKDLAQLKAVQMIGLRSLITVAMSNKDVITGIISFISTIDGRHYDETDLKFAQNFANLICLALENARLNEEAASEIVQRREIEEQLRITQNQLQSALSSGLVGTWVRDLKKNILYPDESLANMFGVPYSAEGYDPALFSAIMQPEDRDLAEEKRIRSYINGEIYETEYKIINGDKSRWFFARGKTDFDEENKPAYFTGVVMDITQRKEAEIALKESEQRYSAAFLNASVGILLADMEGKLMKANDAFTRITGYTEQELAGKDFKAITHPDDLAVNTVLYRRLFACEIPEFVIEKRYFHKDGGIIWVRNSTSLVMDAQNMPIYTISITEDITEQKRVQNELTESEELFRLLSESMPQKVFLTDADGNMSYLNPQWAHFTGLSLAELDGTQITKLIHPDDVDDNLTQWRLAIEAGKPFIYEHRLKNRNGQYIWHLSRALPLKDENDNIIQWIGTITDIHDQKENENKKDEFISIASHELKTPLTTIKVFFQLAKKEIMDESKLAPIAQKAGKQLKRLERLIEDLLDVSRINAGKIQYNTEEFDLRASLLDAVESVQEISPQHRIKIGKFDAVKINGDRYRIEQVIVNLLNNAVKYSPAADKVVVDLESKDGNMVLSVQDFGIGIAEENLNRLFQRFQRIESSGNNFQGLGLGLFISAEIAQRHGGSITITSTPGEGSVFYFSLPLAKASGSALAQVISA